jgi:hypothetical protein
VNAIESEEKVEPEQMGGGQPTRFADQASMDSVMIEPSLYDQVSLDSVIKQAAKLKVID